MKTGTPRGLTPRSLAAMLLLILVSGLLAELAGVIDAGSSGNLIGIEALPVPVLIAFVPLLAVVAGVGALGRARVLSQPELVCVLFGAMIALPLMTLGFWRYQLAGLSTVVRMQDFTKFEALPEPLWPHGENLLAGGLGERTAKRVVRGPAQATFSSGMVRLTNRDPGAFSAVRLRLALGAESRPIGSEGGAVAVPGRPYLFAALVRARELGPEASYFVRAYADDAPQFAFEVVAGKKEAKATPLLPDGDLRVGAYPMALPEQAQRSVTLELGLSGQGRVEWRDPLLYDVRAIEAAYTGFTRVTPAEHAALPLRDRQTAVVVPDRLLSRAGLRYLLGLDYPLGDWLAPVLRLGAFAILVFAMTFGIALVYRKQWLENERYPLPMARVPLVLLGAGATLGGLGQRWLRHPWLLLGLCLGLPWCLAKVAQGYQPNLPDLSLSLGLKSYLADPAWGRTWEGVEFKLYALFLALGLLMELNVLLSLWLGYLAFRLEYWFGQAQGLSRDQDFPYFGHQLLGAYLVYAALLLFFTRQNWLEALRAFRPQRVADAEAPVRRAGLAILGAGAVGFGVWALELGISLASAALLAGHVLMLGFVAAKLRAECGVPRGGFNHALGASGSYDVPVQALLLVPLLGGMPYFGAEGVMTMTLVTAVLLPFTFFNVPGMQVELLEVGRRFGVRVRELGAVALLAVVAALAIGGWIYLVSLYGLGARAFPTVNDFSDRVGGFRALNAELTAAQAALDAGAVSGTPATGSPQASGLWAMGFGAVAAGAVSVLRQFFPGFWFHPAGILVGPTNMMSTLWGSLLVAYLVRLVVLRLGGAATVREKLVPAAVGLFLAALTAHAVAIAISAYYFFFNKGVVKFTGPL